MDGKMDKYVTSLALSKKLKQNGYPQTTVNHWERPVENGELCPEAEYFISAEDCEEHDHKPFAAPISEELLEQLPIHIEGVDGHAYLQITKANDHYEVQYTDSSGLKYRDIPPLLQHQRLCDSLAELWLWLRDNGHALPCSINQSRPS